VQDCGSRDIDAEGPELLFADLFAQDSYRKVDRLAKDAWLQWAEISGDVSAY
jgi:hypothetical protein